MASLLQPAVLFLSGLACIVFPQTLEYGGSIKDGRLGFVDGLNGASGVDVSPDGQYVYVAASIDSALSIFKKSGDSLLFVAFLRDGQNGVDGLSGARGVTVSPDGQFVYVSGPGDSAVSIFKKSGDSLLYVTHWGKDWSVSSFIDAVPLSLAVSADGQFVYTAGKLSPSVLKKSGDSLIFPYNTGGYSSPIAVAANPASPLVYRLGDNAGAIGPYVGSLSISRQSGDTLLHLYGWDTYDDPALVALECLTVSPDGQFVYVGTRANGVIIYKRAGDSLAYVSTALTEQFGPITCVAVSPDNQFVYVSAADDTAITVFKKSGDTLLYVACLQDGPYANDGLFSATGVTVSPTGQYVYAVSWFDDAIAIYKKSGDSLVYVTRIVDNQGGVSDIGDPSSVTVSPGGQFVYVTAAGDDAVTIFKRNAGGTLTMVALLKEGQPGIDSLAGASSVALSPDGQFAYVAASADNAFSVYKKSGDSLVFVQAFADRRTPYGIGSLTQASCAAVSLDGQFVYVTSSADDAITVFKKGGDTLRFIHYMLDGRSGVDGLGGASSAAVSPDSRLVYVASRNDSALSIFRKSNDSLAYVTCLKDGRNGVDGLYGARAVAVSPDGQLVYAAGSNDDALAVFKKSGDTLVFVACLKDGQNGVDGLDGASGLAMTPDGRFVFVTGSVDDAVSVFRKNGDGLDFVLCLKDGQNGVDGLNGASAVAVSDDGLRVYVTASVDSMVSWFSFDPTPPMIAVSRPAAGPAPLSITHSVFGGRLWFNVSVPAGEAFSVSVCDIAGREIMRHDGLGAGKGVLLCASLRGNRPKAAAFYVAKLRAGARTAVDKILIVR